MRGRAYRNLRAAILRANRQAPPDGNDGRCTLHIEGVCSGTATQVHHTLGIQVTGHDPKHMVAACKECNLYVGEPDANANPEPTPRTEWL
jgi:5-methylcytosine-specific restriction endonuclease McrA